MPKTSSGADRRPDTTNDKAQTQLHSAQRRLDQTYEAARTRFLGAAERSGARVTSFPHPNRGIDGEQLAIDVAQLGSDEAPAALVVVSATHGVEGFAGSALQSWWLDERAIAAIPDQVRVVLIHGLNPVGFSWIRRVNEDNVDLNRNFVDWVSAPTNDAYGEIAEMLVPTAWTNEVRAETGSALMEYLDNVGMERFQEIISSGQYDHPTGLFYGGSGPVWSNRWLHDELMALVAPAQQLGVIDIHTGLGDWAHGELISPGSYESESYRRGIEWWGDVRSLPDGESISATLNGDWMATIAAIATGVEVTGAALEFGTVDVLSVLEALRADAWLHAHGDPQGPDAAAIRTVVRAAFADDDPTWLDAIIARFDEVAGAALLALSPSLGHPRRSP